MLIQSSEVVAKDKKLKQESKGLDISLLVHSIHISNADICVTLSMAQSCVL